MEAVKKTKDYTIYKKRSGRYGVKNAENKWVNGDEKQKILLGEKLIKISPTKKKEEPVEEAPAAEAAPAGAEAPKEEEKAEA